MLVDENKILQTRIDALLKKVWLKYYNKVFDMKWS